MTPPESQPQSNAQNQAAPPTYTAVAMQLAARSVMGCADHAAATAQVIAHIAEVETAIVGARAFIEQFAGRPVRLAVLPEYLFTSYPVRLSVPAFAQLAAFEIGGAEYAALGAMAQRLGMFVGGNAYEADPHFPGLYFQTSFAIDPAGDVVLRYRRLFSMFAPSPGDVWDRYLDRYGLDGVFPVARTAIGNLAAIASEEILYPEVARAHALRGAEVFLHSSSEIGSPLATPKDIAKRARAFESMAYVVSANTAGIVGAGLPLASADGNSQVVDPKGRIMAQSYPGETFTAFGEIDIAALRAMRRVPAMTNQLARQRADIGAAAWQGIDAHRSNGLVAGNELLTPDRVHFQRAQEDVIERLIKAGAI